MVRKYFFKEGIFERVDTMEKAYWLGFLYGDGCVINNTLSIFLSEKDEDHMIKFFKFLNFPLEGIKRRKSRNSRQVGAQIHSKKLISDLKKNGVVPRKSKIIKFPASLPDRLKKSFIIGYLDADGSVFVRVEFTSGSKEMLQYIESFAMKEDASLKTRKAKIYHHGNSFRLTYVGNPAMTFLKAVYEVELENIPLKRKTGKVKIF